VSVSRDEGGFALTELLVAMTIGLIVLLAAFLLLDRANSASNEIADRQDAVQRGRRALEDLTRQIRSQVCLGNAAEPITYGDAEQVTFYADLTDGSKNVERRNIIYDPAAKTISERVYAGIGVYPDLTFNATPTDTRVVLSKAELVTDPPTSFLRYYAYDQAGPPGAMRELPTPLSSTDAPLVVMVKIAIVAMPDRGLPASDRDATTFYNDVFVRLANPTSPTQGPRCL